MPLPDPALARRAIIDSLFVSERVFARLGRAGAAAMARARLMDALDRPLVDDPLLAARAMQAMQMARDCGRAFAEAERGARR